MGKKIKMVLYGEPGVGKSVFASKAPHPFFVTTDGNYEWLEDFGAKEEDHIQSTSWAMTKKIIKDIRDNPEKYEKYETLVMDLLEDNFKWSEYEYCASKGVEHISEAGGYGKGYDVTRNEFFIEISKFLDINKHIILIMHGKTNIVKDRRGVEHPKYVPSDKLPDKVTESIEGRVRYFIRCFAVAEEDANGDLVVNRYLSLAPDGTTEYGIVRGIDLSKSPKIIPLDWNAFTEVVGIDTNKAETVTEVKVSKPKKEVKVETPKVDEVKVSPVKVEESKVETPKVELPKVEAPKVETPKVETPKVEAPKVEEAKPISKEDRIAALKAKLAAAKANAK